MSQEQPRRDSSNNNNKEAPIRYGDVFEVGGELASKPITPRDAATVQSVESQIMGGHTQKGGPASIMESAAAKNERAGVVGHRASTNIARNDGTSIYEEKCVGGKRVLTQTLGGEVLGQFVKDDDVSKGIVIGDDDPYKSTVDDDLPATVKAPQVTPTEDFDFISNKSVHADLNPRLSANQDDHNNTQSNVPPEQRETHENDDVISSIPGGMGASMATADHRVSKNK
ncbi:PREDICTED: late embryogenesis abundant protein D-34-like isoform X1 [Lupinus angustifolius]|uniref:late embryogenesis abundant protein D-34-like isoform X1 n=1 Tax=Lupinus angustifolius TaxID=3871 RepID=UPI00092E7A29|nr:PREDICTED: late embryogenesis abundant protein D-34-like isoform X1 [Lupinus angustifolius]